MDHDKSFLYIVAIVAVVAIVALVMLVMKSTSNTAQISSPDRAVQMLDTVGQAYSTGYEDYAACVPDTLKPETQCLICNSLGTDYLANDASCPQGQSCDDRGACVGNY